MLTEDGGGRTEDEILVASGFRLQAEVRPPTAVLGPPTTVLGPPTTGYDPPVITVVFACVHNAGRSQMAAAIFNAFADPGTARAMSAGTNPADRVHPEVVQVMHEVGVDLRDAAPQKLTDDVTRDADWLITMGCGDECPVLPGVRRDDWPIDDPKGRSLADVRRIREEIELRVRSLLWLLNA